MSFDHLLILLVAALFILGPERLPEAASWLARTVSTMRGYVVSAQQQLRAEAGQEFEELRKPLQELRSLSGLSPRAMLDSDVFDDHDVRSGNGTRSPTSERHNRPEVATAPRAAQPLQPGQRPPFDPDAT
ncbi:twin-arginine translocase TatA/TatE family subunit [Allokutzneria oryzae]|uniref:Twin-arginine translocase TatA/TatE family subunit n=1 Tax=Allokutzneria oryzae TaxID=1378989 RepID=A0ABV5ZX67_9PSEU